MTYKVYDLVEKKFLDDSNISLVLRPDGRICYIDRGIEIVIDNCIVLYFPTKFDTSFYIDELGGVHDGGRGWQPDGEYCDSCPNMSCKICGLWNSKHLAQQ